MIINANNEKGQPLDFDLEKLAKHWVEFYKAHGLDMLAQHIPSSFNLPEDKVEHIQEKAKQGYNHLIFFPSASTQDANLGQIKMTMEKPLAGIATREQYIADGSFLWTEVADSFPNRIYTKNRNFNKPYIMMVKDLGEVPMYTLGMTPAEAREANVKNNEQSFTLSEYFIFQRDYTIRHINDSKPHPDTDFYAWLLDSEVPSGNVLKGHWHNVYKQLRINANTLSDKSDFRGFRPSIIIEL